MYLAWPFTSHVISGWSLGAFAGSLSGLAQSYARNSACSLGVIHAMSLPFVGDAVGVASSEGSGVGYGVSLPSSPTKVVTGAPVNSTARSWSWADASIR